MIVSDAFVGNAKMMAKLSGIPDYRFLAVPHPVSNLNKNEIEELVRRVFPQILEFLVARPGIET